MQRLIQLAGGLSSPAILIVLIWCAALLGVAVGPIDYPGQPSAVVLTVVASTVGFGLAFADTATLAQRRTIVEEDAHLCKSFRVSILL